MHLGIIETKTADLRSAKLIPFISAAGQSVASLQLAVFLRQTVVFAVQAVALRFKSFLVLPLAHQQPIQTVEFHSEFANL